MRFPLRGRELVALEDVNLRMADQEFCCIVGPSGCGKTTFLRILAGLERQTAGELHLEVTDPARPLSAMVFQEQSVFPWMTVEEQTRALLQEELLRVWESDRKTVVYITHSIDEALVLGDRVLVMSARPGHIKAEIPVTLPRPRSVYELKSTPEFAELVAKVWEPLRREVLTSYAVLASCP